MSQNDTIIYFTERTGTFLETEGCIPDFILKWFGSIIQVTFLEQSDSLNFIIHINRLFLHE